MPVPSHTPVPEYIRLIAEGRYTEAYMINWDSNVFPGILGRRATALANRLAAADASRKSPSPSAA